MFSRFDRLVRPKADQVLIDFGCGTGAFTSRLAARHPQLKVRGVDLCPRSIQVAGRKHPHLDFHCGDVENVDMPDGSVDIVCFFGLLHHFPDFSNVSKEAHRILKPGGRYFALDPHHYNPIFWLFRSRTSPLYCPSGVTENERLITARESRDVFSSAGFESNADVIGGLKFKSVEGPLLQTFLGAYNFLDSMVSATPLGRWVGPWVISWGTKK